MAILFDSLMFQITQVTCCSSVRIAIRLLPVGTAANPDLLSGMPEADHQRCRKRCGKIISTYTFIMGMWSRRLRKQPLPVRLECSLSSRSKALRSSAYRTQGREFCGSNACHGLLALSWIQRYDYGRNRSACYPDSLSCRICNRKNQITLLL